MQTFSATELVQKTQLSMNGVRHALNALEETGVINRISNSQKLFQLRSEHPLAEGLKQLYKLEQAFPLRLKEALKIVFQDQPVSVWIESSCFDANFSPNDTVEVLVLGTPEKISNIVQNSLAEISQIENLFDLTIYVRGITRADIEAFESNEASKLPALELILGIPHPLLQPKTTKKAGHSRTRQAQSDASRAISIAAAKKLERDPSLLPAALELIESQLAKASESSKNELLQWKRLLEKGSLKRITQLLVGTSDVAVRRRQSSPFPLLLTEEEKTAALESLKSEGVTS
jgi:hypothetical protein